MNAQTIQPLSTIELTNISGGCYCNCDWYKETICWGPAGMGCQERWTYDQLGLVENMTMCSKACNETFQMKPAMSCESISTAGKVRIAIGSIAAAGVIVGLIMACVYELYKHNR